MIHTLQYTGNLRKGDIMRNTFRFLKRFIIFASFFVNAFLVFWLYDLVGNNTLLRDAANTLKVTVVTLESKVKDLGRDVTDLNREIADKNVTVTKLESKLRSAICKNSMTEEEFQSLKTADDVGPFLREFISRIPGVTITDVTTKEAIWTNKRDFNIEVSYNFANDMRNYSQSYNIIYGASIGQKRDKDIHSVMAIGDACFLYLSDYDIVIVND
jgi:hypothetical protein